MGLTDFERYSVTREIFREEKTYGDGKKLINFPLTLENGTIMMTEHVLTKKNVLQCLCGGIYLLSKKKKTCSHERNNYIKYVGIGLPAN